MRIIKFRGKRVDNGEWVYGGIAHLRDVPAIITNYRENDIGADIDESYIIPETIGQYTGLCDVNGKEIYEGDIVKDVLGCLGEIIYKDKHTAFIVKGWEDGYKWWYDNKIEVIGNIYDNPELLEKESK